MNKKNEINREKWENEKEKEPLERVQAPKLLQILTENLATLPTKNGQ